MTDPCRARPAGGSSAAFLLGTRFAGREAALRNRAPPTIAARWREPAQPVTPVVVFCETLLASVEIALAEGSFGLVEAAFGVHVVVLVDSGAVARDEDG